MSRQPVTAALGSRTGGPRGTPQPKAPKAPTRPLLKPALRRLWRDPSTLQLGIDPKRAVVLGGVGANEVRLLDALDGTRDAAGLAVAAEMLGVSPRAAHRLVTLLARAGVLDDAAGEPAAFDGLSADERERLRPDLAALTLVHTDPSTPTAVLRRRRERTVLVRGAGRVGAPLASLLAAAGVGRVAGEDPRATRPADAAPGGLTLDDAGLPRERAAERAVRRHAPSTDVGPLRSDERADLVVIADDPAPAAVQAAFLRDQTPHLYAAVRETTGVVGPFVLVGATPCQRCLDLTRAERDEAWPWLAAQLAGRGHRPTDACDAVLAALVAGHAAREALAFLDAEEPRAAPIATYGGTLELGADDWRLRRRSWRVHPGCGCSWGT